MPKAKAKKTYTESQMYTGREITVTYRGKAVTGKISNGGQCSSTQFAFSGPRTPEEPYGIEECVARSAIVSLGK